MTVPVERHDEWTARLSEYLDDDLAPGERHAVEGHLATCEGCAAILKDLRGVVRAAAALPQAAPGEEVWQAVAARIRETPRAAQGRMGHRFAFTVPQLAAASMLLAILSGWAALRLNAPAEVSGPFEASIAVEPADEPVAAVAVSDPQYDAAVVDLERALELGRGRLDPATVATVEDDLRIIDDALEEARQALMADPANGYLSGHVVDTRRRKLDLLRRAAALTSDSQM